MTDLEQRILDIVQDGFPVVERPYAAIAEQLGGITEQQVFDAVENLRASGVIRRIGGVYDSKKLGYTSRLCCGIVPESAEDGGESPIEQFAAAVNEIPAITHNYVRSHRYNVWFTVIGHSEQEIQEVVHGLEQRTALCDTHILNAKKMFKINTVMTRRHPRVPEATKVPEQRRVATKCHSEQREESSREAPVLKASDRDRIRMLSGDLSHSLTPFTEDLIAGIQADLATKRMRRFGAVLRHQQAGFSENAMVCFVIPGSEPFSAGTLCVDQAGALLAAEPFVSHCYERDAFGPFPYNVYAMVHGNSPEDLSAKIESLVKKLENPEYAVLRSERELKKTSFRFEV
ncbi:MAG: Lrp/AsnC family transcriptional regulator [Fibrobacter sp.]|nr:Lrp/AsnC family transcriptional regulator [Fibrobacter sp.]